MNISLGDDLLADDINGVNADLSTYDDIIKWKHFPRYWPFVPGIHRSPVVSPHKGQWRGALMFSLICARINVWANNRKAGDLRRHRTHYDVIVMTCEIWLSPESNFVRSVHELNPYEVFRNCNDVFHTVASGDALYSGIGCGHQPPRLWTSWFGEFRVQKKNTH